MSLEESGSFSCPYCGENNRLLVDLSAGNSQEFVVDCEVCCAPVMVRLKISGGEVVFLDAQPENG